VGASADSYYEYLLKQWIQTGKTRQWLVSHLWFLANKLYAIARPSVCRLSVICNTRAPYSGGSNFPQYFYGIWYLGHPLTSGKIFTEIVPGEPLRQGSLTQEG